MLDLLVKNTEIKDWEVFDDHKFVYAFNDDSIGLKGYIAIHRRNEQLPSFGATRLWNYGSEDEALRDALGLSRIMSYKAAMASLPYGGAKAVIIGNDNWKTNRRELLRAYAEVVNKLEGSFITGTDVGLNQDDLRIAGEVSKYFVGFNDKATESTALGIFDAIAVCLEQVFGNDSVAGRKFAIQGLGKVGTELTKLLYPTAEKIYVCDINENRVKDFIREFPKCVAVPISEIHKQDVDVFSPCALSHSLTIKVINELRCPIVCGGANSQLEREEVGSLLFAKDILYAPDYVANSGGLISVADEYGNEVYDSERLKAKVMTIKDTMTNILVTSQKMGEATNFVANMMAEKVFNGYK